MLAPIAGRGVNAGGRVLGSFGGSVAAERVPVELVHDLVAFGVLDGGVPDGLLRLGATSGHGGTPSAQRAGGGGGRPGGGQRLGSGLWAEKT